MKEIAVTGLIRAILFYPIIAIMIAITDRGGPCTPGLQPILFFLGFLISMISFIRYLLLIVLFGKKYLLSFLIHTVGFIGFCLIMYWF